MMSSADLFAGWQYREPPSTTQALDALCSGASIVLPEAYLSLLRLSKGGGGPLAVEPGWFQLWPAEEVLDSNREYEVQESLPFLFGFGSSGGGELLAFDTRRDTPWKVVMVPFIGPEEGDIVVVAEDFGQFLQATGREAASS